VSRDGDGPRGPGRSTSVNRYSTNYLNRAGLEAALAEASAGVLETQTEIRLLNLGCGNRSYLELFDQSVARHVAVDVSASPFTDVIARGEELPFAVASFDVVLCVQVLEHVRNPSRVIAEIGRVLCPEGTALLTTHGTFFYHPVPEDLWRWTHEGLRLLLRRSGLFDQIDVQPIGGTFSALALLNARYLDAALSRMVRGRLPGLRTVGKALRASVVYSLNRLGPWFDRRVPDFSRLDKEGTLFLSYLAVSTRAVARSEQQERQSAVSARDFSCGKHWQSEGVARKTPGETALDA